MKKFLTVLLALSVVFTYTVGTAFAAGTTVAPAPEKVQALKDAKVVAEKVVRDNYDAAMELIADAQFGYAMPGKTAEETKADREAAWAKVDVKGQLQKFIETEYAKEAKDCGNYVSDVEAYALTVFDLTTNATSTEQANALKDKIYELMVYEAALNQYNADLAEAVDPLDNIDWSLYSSTEIYEQYDKTYLAVAQDIIAEAKATVERDASFTLEDKKSGDVLTTKIGDVMGYVNSVVTPISIGEGTDAVLSGLYSVNTVPTIEWLIDQGLIKDATTASIKAQIAANVADYLQNDKTAAAREFAKNYSAVLNYLAEEIPTDGLLNAIKGDYTHMDTAKTVSAAKMKNAIEAIEALETAAARYAAEKDATGALVRDAKEVEKIVSEAKLYEYAHAIGYTDGEYDAVTAKAKIKAMTTAGDAAKLAFAKEVAKVKLADAKATIIDDYYPLEASKIEAKYEKVLAKIEAAKTPTDAENAVNATKTPDFDLGRNIMTAAQVDAKLTYATGTAEATDKAAIDNEIAYVNYGKTVLDAGYVLADDEYIKDTLNAIYGEAGARTNAEIKAVDVNVADFVAKLPTVGTLDAAKTVAEAAIKALPANATEADMDAVAEAYKLAGEYANLDGALATDVQAKLAKAIASVYADMTKNFALENAKVDKTDKVALRALIEKIDTANELVGADKLFDKKATGESYAKFSYYSLVTALNKIRDAELKAVEDAINAIPINVTEADKATVEAARKLYDEFVKEWTVYEEWNNFDAASEVSNFRTLALAEATIAVLQAEKDIKAVESLKIKASSSAVKGKITVKWTVKGDVPAGTVYKVYKSTKAQSGYAYMGKTTKNYMANKKNLKKGKRYFYKVKAVLVVDGVTYTSDWSNKANRFAK